MDIASKGYTMYQTQFCNNIPHVTFQEICAHKNQMKRHGAIWFIINKHVQKFVQWIIVQILDGCELNKNSLDPSLQLIAFS